MRADIAREVATAVTGRLLPEEHARLSRPVTDDPLAFEEYLRGFQAAAGPVSEATYRSALDHLDRATARLVEVRSHPELATLRADPRWAALDQQLRF